MDRPVRLVLVEDSPTMAVFLRQMLVESGFVVAATAGSVAEAETAVATEHPDLVLSDVRLPGADGIELTRRLLGKRGLPVVLITAYDPRNPALIFQAMEAGALEVLPKPPARSDPGFGEYHRSLASTLRILAGTPVISRRPRLRRLVEQPAAVVQPVVEAPIVAIGASTGGPPVVADLLRALSGRRIAFGAVAQHIIPEFAETFRSWLEGIAGRPVRLAQVGERPEPGVVYTPPAHSHLRLRPAGTWDVIPAGSLALAHVPSVDVLFDSLARFAPHDTLAVLLTGMGSDGAEGLSALRAAGAWTAAQRPDTAVVDSMPQSAIARGAASEVLAPEEIAARFQALAAAEQGGRR